MSSRARKTPTCAKPLPSASRTLILRSRRGILRISAGANEPSFDDTAASSVRINPSAAHLIRALWDEPIVEYQA